MQKKRHVVTNMPCKLYMNWTILTNRLQHLRGAMPAPAPEP